MDTSLSELQAWTGRSETLRDQIGATPVKALNATLDHPAMPADPGTPLPPLWHWLYFLPLHRQSEIGPDGHAKRGGFLPPVPLPRRMWAGSQFEFRSPRARRRLGRAHVDHRRRLGQGRPHRQARLRQGAPRGALQRRRRARASSSSTTSSTATPSGRATSSRRRSARETGAAWQREIVPDDVLLFRYSALTFNGHRIHYDRKYVTEVEGYPGLIVHGPLIATLLMDLVRRNLPAADVATFRFKAVRPTFDLQPVPRQRPAAGRRQDDPPVGPGP